MDNYLDEFFTESRPNGRGGRREGAGRKPKQEQELLDAEITESGGITYNVARARNEAAKAVLNELEVKIKSGEYVARDAVRQATTTALATLAQGLRSIPDNIERTLAIAPEVAEAIAQAIDESLADLANELQAMCDEGITDV